MEIKQSRSSNFELLRIVLILFVIALHFNGEPGKVMEFTQNFSSFNKYCSRFFEALFICSVNTFVLLSGYFLSKRKKGNIRKVINLFFVVIFYSIFVFFIKVAFGIKEFSLRSLFGKIIPYNYYAWLYGATFLLSPFINLIFEKLEKKQVRSFMVLIGILFCLIPTFEDFLLPKIGMTASGVSPVSSDGNGAGYTLINFILLYCIGSFIRYENFTLKPVFAVSGYFVSALCIFFGNFINPHAYAYCNFFVISESIFLFLIFKNLSFKCRFINFIAKSTWGVFVLHFCTFDILMKYISIENICSQNGIKFILFSALFIFTVYALSVCMDIIFTLILKPLHLLLDKMSFCNYEISTEQIEPENVEAEK